jgi:hypothetical protein
MLNIDYLNEDIDFLKLKNIFESLNDFVILLNDNNISYAIGGYLSLVFKSKKIYRTPKDIDLSIHNWDDYNKLESILALNNKYKISLSKNEIERGSPFKLTFNLNSIIMKVRTTKNDMPIRIDIFYNENKEDKEIFKMNDLEIFYNYKTCLSTKKYYIDNNSSSIDKHQKDLSIFYRF